MFHRKKQIQGTDAAHKALFINEISVFRVDDIVTLKTLKLLIQKVLRGALKIYSRPRARTRASGSGSAPRNS